MQELAVVFEDVAIVQAVPAQADEDIVLTVLLDRREGFQARLQDMSLSWVPGCCRRV